VEDLKPIFILEKTRSYQEKINKYFGNLTGWLSHWHLKLNAKKYCFKIVSNGGRGDLQLDLNRGNLSHTTQILNIILGDQSILPLTLVKN
jgi:hypothetical protein